VHTLTPKYLAIKMLEPCHAGDSQCNRCTHNMALLEATHHPQGLASHLWLALCVGGDSHAFIWAAVLWRGVSDVSLMIRWFLVTLMLPADLSGRAKVRRCTGCVLRSTCTYMSSMTVRTL
jgi:hypothetical protein